MSFSSLDLQPSLVFVSAAQLCRDGLLVCQRAAECGSKGYGTGMQTDAPTAFQASHHIGTIKPLSFPRFRQVGDRLSFRKLRVSKLF